jgi:hypothetical protein
MGPMAVPPQAFSCSETELAFAAFQRAEGGLVLREYRRETLDAETFQHGLLGGPPREPRVLAERVAGFVSSLETPVKEAVLVVPDAWLRTAFADIGEIPSNGSAREDVLRWKLKRLVPFRVDELRVRATEVSPLPGQAGQDGDESRRMLLGFGIETLFGHLERSFREAGVNLGRIANRGLSALGAVAADEGVLTGMALASEDGYTMAFARGTEPVLHRFKPFSGDLPVEARSGSVRRDGRLTRTFLEDHYPGTPLGEIVVAAPDGTADDWVRWLEEGFGHPVKRPGAAAVVPVRAEAGASWEGGSGPGWVDLLPLAGTVCQEVAR